MFLNLFSYKIRKYLLKISTDVPTDYSNISFRAVCVWIKFTYKNIISFAWAKVYIKKGIFKLTTLESWSSHQTFYPNVPFHYSRGYKTNRTIKSFSKEASKWIHLSKTYYGIKILQWKCTLYNVYIEDVNKSVPYYR